MMLYLPHAIGCRADVELNIEDFNTIGDQVPLIANLKPHGKVREEFVN